MSEPVQKCVNNAISNQNYAQKLFIAFKMAYSCCCGLRGNLDFPDFPPKKFYNRLQYMFGTSGLQAEQQPSTLSQTIHTLCMFCLNAFLLDQ